MQFSSNVGKSFAMCAALICIVAMTALACTANDTLFIKLTETPLPTATIPPPEIDTKFVVGDSAQIIGPSPFQQVGMAGNPGPYIVAQSPGLCYPGIEVKILQIGLNQQDPSDDNIYYSVSCSGGRAGWLAEHQLTSFLRSMAVVVEAEDSEGATMYFQNDVNGRTVPTKCPNGTSSVVSEVLSGKTAADENVYVQITCNRTRAYVLEQDLVRAQ